MNIIKPESPDSACLWAPEGGAVPTCDGCLRQLLSALRCSSRSGPSGQWHAAGGPSAREEALSVAGQLAVAVLRRSGGSVAGLTRLAGAVFPLRDARVFGAA